MNRRALQGIFGVLVLLALGAGVLFLRRGKAWLSASWISPWWAAAALLVPIVFWGMMVFQDRRLPKLRISTTFALRHGPKGFRTRFRDLPAMFRVAALVFGLVALARPQTLVRPEVSEEMGIDIVVVLDLSGSMRAVMDGPTTAGKTKRQSGAPKRATRLDTAKDVIQDFIRGRRSDRIGVVVFGKAPYVLSPPTLDYTLLSTLVSQMTLELIDGQGTAIGDALGAGVARLSDSQSRSKVAILLTDGDSNAGEFSPEYATHLAKKVGVRAYTVQIGNGDEVDVQDGVDILGQPHYRKEKFPVNPELLKKIAKDTGAEAFVANDRAELERSMNAILDSLEKTRIEAQSATIEELFPMPLQIAAVLVFVEALLRIFLLRRFP